MRVPGGGIRAFLFLMAPFLKIGGVGADWPRLFTRTLGSEVATASTFNSMQRFAQIRARGPGHLWNSPDPWGQTQCRGSSRDLRRRTLVGFFESSIE